MPILYAHEPGELYRILLSIPEKGGTYWPHAEHLGWFKTLTIIGEIKHWGTDEDGDDFVEISEEERKKLLTTLRSRWGSDLETEKFHGSRV